MMQQMTWWALAAITVIGAVVVLVSREVMRTMLGLGAFLIGVAGLYGYYAVPFVAVSQIFVYVGGVLVLFLFAVMTLRRDEKGMLTLTSRPDIGAVVTAIGLFAVLVVALRPLGAGMSAAPLRFVGVDAIASQLLGPMLPQFEAAGVLLLAALVAALAVTGGGGEE